LAEGLFTAPPDLTAVVGSLPNVQCLSLRKLVPCSSFTGIYSSNSSNSSKSGPQHRQLPSLLLQEQQLRNVTRLELEGGPSAESLQEMGSLTPLQHLQLRDIRSSDIAQALAAVSQLHALSLLQLGHMICNLTSSILPCLSGLTALRTLKLKGSTLALLYAGSCAGGCNAAAAPAPAALLMA
jgi:hypothetical protein